MPKLARRKNETTTPALIALGFLASAFQGATGEELPSRIRIANWGANNFRGSNVVLHVNEQTVKQLPQLMASRGYDTVSGDFEHQSVKGHENFKPDPRDYWAHGKVEVVPGKGIDYVPESYTPAGKMHAASYPDVSGLFLFDKNTKAIIGVRSVALCEHGQVPGARNLQAIAAALNDGYALPADVNDVLGFARDVLDLGEDASTADISDGLKQMLIVKNGGDGTPTDKGNSSTNTDPTHQTPDTMDPKDIDTKIAAAIAESQKTVNAGITALTETVKTLAGSVTQLATSNANDQHNRAVEVELAAAVSQGKKLPDSLKKKDDAGRYVVAADFVKEIAASFPVTEPVQFQTPEMLAASATANSNNLSGASVEEICASLGVKQENFEKQAKGAGLIRSGNEPFEKVKTTLATKA